MSKIDQVHVDTSWDNVATELIKSLPTQLLKNAGITPPNQHKVLKPILKWLEENYYPPLKK